MSTFYLDYAGGNDGNNGTSFANRWKTITSGATAANIAPGDTIRIMGSPAPTSLGVNGTWTDGPWAATKAIGSSTNAAPIVVTITGHGYSNGDFVIITGHTTNTSANGTWVLANITANTFELSGSTGNGVGGASGTTGKINNSVVTLASAVTANIGSVLNRGEGRTAWTASANVTASLQTVDMRQGDCSDSIDIAGGFTTGLAAYKALALLTDFSAYKQVSFWIKQTAGTVAIAGDVSIRLCTDTIGAVSVNTIAIPGLVALNRWIPITIDTGGALSALAQSVAFYVDTDRGAQTFLISNVIACKDSTNADSLSLTSLIGKNSGTETFYGIQSINGTLVILDNNTNTFPYSGTIGYSGTSETVTTYKRETIPTAMATATSTIVQQIQDSGTSGSVIIFSGGWNRTDMTTQTLETWFDGRNGLGSGLQTNSKTYFDIDKLAFVRYQTGIDFVGSANCTITNIVALNNNSGSGLSLSTTTPTNNTFTLITSICNNTSAGVIGGATASLKNIFTAITNCNNNAGVGCQLGHSCQLLSGTFNNNNGRGITASGNNVVVKNVTTSKNQTEGINAAGAQSIFDTITCAGNLTYAMSLSVGDIYVYNLTSSGNTTGGLSFSSTTIGRVYLFNASIAESTEFQAVTNYVNTRVISVKHDATADNHYIYTDGGTILSEASVRHTASGISWKFSPTSANRTINYPLNNTIATVACAASTQVTVTCWFRRTHANLVGTLRVRGGQIGGVASDVTASMSVGADTWEQLTLTFTPNEAGVVEADAFFYASDAVTTYSGYVDDFAVSQA